MVFGISTYSNGALNPPRIVASAVAGVGVETVVPPLPTPPAVYGGRQKNIDHPDHRACTAHAHTPTTRDATAPATPITFTSTTAKSASTVSLFVNRPKHRGQAS